MEVARSLREDHAFAGYIHLKTIPDAIAGAAGGCRAIRRPAVDQRGTADRGREAVRPEKSQAGIRSAMGQLRWRIEEAKEARKPATPASPRPSARRARRASRPPARARR